MTYRLLLTLWLAGAAHGAFFDTGWDYEARRWQTNIANSSGTLSSTSYMNGIIFMQQSKRWGIRPLLGRVGIYLGGETNAIQCPIIHDFFTTTDANDDLIGFTAADYTEATGLTGGLNKYLRCNGATAMNLQSATHTNIHMATYNRTDNSAAEDEMGLSAAAVGAYGVVIDNAASAYVFMGNNVTSAANTNALGFVLSTRTATNVAVTYRNGTAVVTDSANDNGSTVFGGFLIVHAFNSVGVPTAFSTKAQCYYAFGRGIPAARVGAYNILVQGVQQRANRKVN